MKFRDQLLAEQSKANTTYIASVVGENKKYFSTLVDLMFGPDMRLAARAAYTLDYCDEVNAGLLHHEYERIIGHLENIKNQSIKRHCLRMLTRYDIPEIYQGLLFNYCLTILEQNTDSIAVKAHAMQLLYNISNSQPDLKPELKNIFGEYLENESAGLKSRSAKLIGFLKKELNH